MYNDSYYSRRGRTIERKKVEGGYVINPKLVPVYYNYFKDNGLLPSPPAPVEDGSYVTYQVNQEYSFPSSWTSLNSALGTMIDTFEIPVDITEVDSIRLEYILTPSGSSTERRPFNGFSISSSGGMTPRYDTLPAIPSPSYTYILFFYRTSASTFAVSLHDTNEGINYYPMQTPLTYVKKIDDTGSTMVVKSITVSTHANE